MTTEAKRDRAKNKKNPDRVDIKHEKDEQGPRRRSLSNPY